LRQHLQTESVLRNERPPANDSSLTAIEISAAALISNVAQLRTRIAPQTRICAVVKANGYGHGVTEVFSVLANIVDAFAVARPEEALHLRQAGCRHPILVFFPISACLDGHGSSILEELIAADVTLTLVSCSEIAAVNSAARRAGSAAQVHVKIDSGMGRSGVHLESAPALVAELRRASLIELSGLYTHFAVAEEADKSFTVSQLKQFLDAVESVGTHSGMTIHAANSAAAIDLAETHLDMVRLGLAIYGYQPSDTMHTVLPLRPSLRLTARLIQVKDMPEGSRSGYGLRHTFTRPSRMGVLSIGYADGCSRCLSGHSMVSVRGALAHVCGAISMDQMCIDLTDVPGASVGDEVEVISPDPSAPHSVENLARLAGTIPYEVLCRLGSRIRRQIVDVPVTS
jgi:alanine racemase